MSKSRVSISAYLRAMSGLMMDSLIISVWKQERQLEVFFLSNRKLEKLFLDLRSFVTEVHVVGVGNVPSPCP